MSTTWKWLFEILARVLLPILNLISPEIKKILEEFLISLYKKALETANPWDDFFAGLLLDLFGIPHPTSS